MSAQWTYVYVIAAMKNGRPCSPTKVGMSKAWEARLQNLSTSSPIELHAIVALPLPSRHLAEAIEHAAHDALQQYWLRGEWFDVCPIKCGLVVCSLIKLMLREMGLSEPHVDEFLDRFGATEVMRVLLNTPEVSLLHEGNNGSHTQH